jgi:D-alanyl-D-alanine carboxypeptidase
LDGNLSRALQDTHDRWQKAAPCLGSNVAIIDARHGRWSGTAGWRTIDDDAPMPIGASFYIYSVTKTFVATRLLQLGVALDRPISSYLAAPALPDGVTVRRLLNHTAGVPSYTDQPDYAPAVCRSPGEPWSAEEVFRRCCSGSFDFPPGEGWHYSNTGYLLLARLLEAITGTSLAAAIGDGILTPLGLDRTYVATAIDRGTITPGYTRELSADERMIDATPIYHPGWCLTGVMVSTVDQVAHFLDSLMSGQLLPPAAMAAMTEPISVGGPDFFYRRPSYGLGLMIDPEWGHGGLFGHGGGGPGANAWSMHLPDFHGRRVTLVALCNTTIGGHPFYLAKDLLRVLATV